MANIAKTLKRHGVSDFQGLEFGRAGVYCISIRIPVLSSACRARHCVSLGCILQWEESNFPSASKQQRSVVRIY